MHPPTADGLDGDARPSSPTESLEASESGDGAGSSVEDWYIYGDPESAKSLDLDDMDEGGLSFNTLTSPVSQAEGICRLTALLCVF